MMQAKPFSQACENNKDPILKVLQRLFANTQHVLEIGSGTGQHAVYFAEHLPQLRWQPSDQACNLPGLKLWCGEYRGDNLAEAHALDVTQAEWPQGFDAVFSANTAHIMPLQTTLTMIETIAKALPPGGIFALYGPFKYGGHCTSDSNVSFDIWLKEQQAHQGIRDFERLHQCASDFGMVFLEDNPMPANNRLLAWQKAPAAQT